MPSCCGHCKFHCTDHALADDTDRLLSFSTHALANNRPQCTASSASSDHVTSRKCTSRIQIYLLNNSRDTWCQPSDLNYGNRQILHSWTSLTNNCLLMGTGWSQPAAKPTCNKEESISVQSSMFNKGGGEILIIFTLGSICQLPKWGFHYPNTD